VLLRKPPSHFEIINDLDTRIINFFDVMRTRPRELIRAISLTPYSRLELKRAQEKSDDPLEEARRFYVRGWQAWNGNSKRSEVAWLTNLNTGTQLPVKQWQRLSHLSDVSKRLRQVYIECSPALDIITRYDKPETLFYCDPPYTPDTRSEKKMRDYANEMTLDDHIALGEKLKNIKGMVLISGYDNPLYRDLYAGWQMVTKETRTVKSAATECLWINPSAQMNQTQRRLF
jgi:DNA adenine methylase